MQDFYKWLPKRFSNNVGFQRKRRIQYYKKGTFVLLLGVTELWGWILTIHEFIILAHLN